MADRSAEPWYPALHRARYVAARLSAPQGRARPVAIDHGGHVHPPRRVEFPGGPGAYSGHA